LKMVVVNTLKNLLMLIVIFFRWWINSIKLKLGELPHNNFNSLFNTILATAALNLKVYVSCFSNILTRIIIL